MNLAQINADLRALERNFDKVIAADKNPSKDDIAYGVAIALRLSGFSVGKFVKPVGSGFMNGLVTIRVRGKARIEVWVSNEGVLVAYETKYGTSRSPWTKNLNACVAYIKAGVKRAI